MFLVLTFTLFARLVSGIESCSFSIPTIYNLPLAKIELNTTENGDNESEGKIRSLYKGCQLFWERKANSHCTHCPNQLVDSSKILSLCNIADSGYRCCVHAVRRDTRQPCLMLWQPGLGWGSWFNVALITPGHQEPLSSKVSH